MKRRTFLAGTGVALLAPFAGCLGDTDNPSSEEGDDTGDTENKNDDGNGVEDRVKECENQYIQNEVVTRDDETIDESLQPAVIDTESQEDGEFVEVRTEFGATRATDNGPDEHLDYLVTAYYLVSDETVYRTEGTEAEGDPHDGITVDC